ncbi:MAG: hypothetical protein ASARMPREDX12_005928 [Alectoria sarmentosa]|nr:MAG: hypothetical protein ASARMPREDX12_005928 [Alectoria sarmentosa]
MPRIFGFKKKKPLAAEESGSASSLVDPPPHLNQRLGLRVLHEPLDPSVAVVDIVFVHGLTGDPAGTWIHPGSGTYWPATLLSLDIPNSRILSFGYDADVVNFWSPVSQNRVGNHALNLLGGLTGLREETNSENRKIIFVAHSLGGLVTQDCLWTSTNHPETHLRQVSSCAVGISFLDSLKATKPLFLVPFSRDATFIDRVNIFENIDEKIKDHRRISLSGIGGVGTRQRLEQAYRDIARRLELPGWNDPSVDTLLSVSEWFNENEGWLMVLDNADDRDTFFAKSTSAAADVERTRPLSDYLPQDSQGLMLITTRDKRMSERLAGRDASIIVRPMTFSEAEKLLRSQLEKHHAWNDDDSRTLLTELEYIPLAITQAAAFISQNSITLAKYLDMFRTNDSEIQDLLNKDLGDPRRDSRSQNSVIRTWKLSFDLISKQELRAAEMLSLMAVLDRQGIPECLLQNETDSNVDVITGLGTLRAFSLITIEDNSEGYQLHRLVQLATRNWLELQGTKEKWQEQALLVLADQFPNGEFENWKTCESFLPHAQTVIQYKDIVERCSEQYSYLVRNIAWFDMTQGRYEDACKGSTAAFELQEKLFGLEHPETLTSINNLAMTYMNQQRWDEAEKLNVQVMNISIRVHKEDHPFTLISMNNLASTYLEQGRWDEAENLGVRVMETRIRILKEDHPDALISMGNLAMTYRKQGRWDEAEKLQVQVMETRLRVLKEDHPDTLTSMNNLALTYWNQERWDEAEKLQVRVMETSIRVHKEDHPFTLISMNNLASTYMNQKRWDEAEKLHVQVMKTRLRILKEDHPDTLTSMNNLAWTYHSQERHCEAIALMRKVVNLCTKKIGANHPDTLASIRALNDWSDTSHSGDENPKDPDSSLAIEDGNADSDWTDMSDSDNETPEDPDSSLAIEDGNADSD